MADSINPLELLIIVGLPGSGKTTYLRKLVQEKRIDGYCDDYEYGPLRDNDPALTEKDIQLMEALKQGQRWAIADVRYCDPAERAKLTEALKELSPHVRCSFEYFENDPVFCANNAVVREGSIPRHQINLIYYYTELYGIPKGAKTLKIHNAKP